MPGMIQALVTLLLSLFVKLAVLLGTGGVTGLDLGLGMVARVQTAGRVGAR
jgi:hypothetical protein